MTDSYHVEARWVEAWSGGGPYVAGWCVCEARRDRVTGVLTIARGDAVYCHEADSYLSEHHHIHMVTEKVLRSFAQRRMA